MNKVGSLPSGGVVLSQALTNRWSKDLEDTLKTLPGVPVSNPNMYQNFVNPNFVQVCPLYDSDVSDRHDGTVEASNERKGLLAFKILDTKPADDPMFEDMGFSYSDSDLPFLEIEIADPSTINIDNIGPWSPSTGGGTNGGGISLVK